MSDLDIKESLIVAFVGACNNSVLDDTISMQHCLRKLKVLVSVSSVPGCFKDSPTSTDYNLAGGGKKAAIDSSEVSHHENPNTGWNNRFVVITVFQ